MNHDYDLVVIGGGPAGYVAAIRSAQLGMKTAVIEKYELGGVCLNWGCIPTKSLLRCGEVYNLAKRGEEFGISFKGIEVNLPSMIKRSRKISQQLTDGIKMLMRKNNIKVIEGHAKLAGNGIIEILTSNSNDKLEKLKANHIILATGARPRNLPNLPLDHKLIWDYKDALLAEQLPSSLLVVGSGAIGVEFASFYNALGTKVTIVEINERILSAEDHEISEAANKSFTKQGIRILTQSKINKLTSFNDRVEVELITADGKLLIEEFNRVLSAVGVIPNTEDLGLENTKVELDNNRFIKVDDYMRTKENGVYAIGDITYAPLLAHKASHQAVICVEKIANLPNVHPMRPQDIPGCTYSYPQIASVGYTEKQALDKGLEIKVGRFPYHANGKAKALGDEEGFVKTIFDANSGELLGVHMIGSEVTELISAMVLVKKMEGTEIDIMEAIFPHPTLSEALHESALSAYKRALHY